MRVDVPKPKIGARVIASGALMILLGMLGLVFALLFFTVAGTHMPIGGAPPQPAFRASWLIWSIVLAIGGILSMATGIGILARRPWAYRVGALVSIGGALCVVGTYLTFDAGHPRTGATYLWYALLLTAWVLEFLLLRGSPAVRTARIAAP